MMHYFANRRERIVRERAEERAHQLAMITALTRGLESMFDSLALQQKENASAMIEVAKSNAVQAESFGKWIDCFKVTEPPTTSVVHDEDEYEREQQDMLADLPPEFKLALDLQREVRADNKP